MKIVQKNQNINKNPNNTGKDKIEKGRITPSFFIFILSFLHVLGLILLASGIIVGLFFGRIEFNSADKLLFSKPIDLLVYFSIVLGAIILCGMMIYWVIFLKIRKIVANEKRDNEFVIGKWMKYRHIMDFEKVKPSHPKNLKKKK